MMYIQPDIRYNKLDTIEIKTFQKMAMKIADLVEEKNKAYGDSFFKAGEFLKLLYPNGIKIEQYNDMLTIVRVFDKLMRIATDKDALGENPWQDVNGYSLLALVNEGVKTDEQKEIEKLKEKILEEKDD